MLQPRTQAWIRRFLVVSLVGLLLPGTIAAFTQARSPVGLPSDEPGAPTELTHQLKVWEDTAGDRTIEDVSSAQWAGKFWPHPPRTPNFSYTDSVYWLRFPVVQGDNQDPWFLEVAYPLLQQLDVYISRGGEEIAHYQGGSREPFGERERPHRNPVFPLHLEPDEPAEVFVRVESDTAMVVPLHLWQADEFAAHAQNEYLLLGIYYGLLALVIIYHCFLYYYQRNPGNLYFILYLVSIGLYLLVLNGLAFQYLWPKQPEWASVSINSFILLACATTALLVCSILALHHYSRRVEKLLIWIPVVTLPLAAVAPFLPFTPMMLFAIGAVLVTGVSGVGALALDWRRGNPASGPVLAAWVVLFAGALLVVGRSLDLLPHSLLTLHGLQLGSAGQFLILHLVLAYQMRQLHWEREQAETRAEQAQVQVSQTTKKLDRARRLATTDELTGLANRRRFQHLAQQLLRQDQEQGRSTALVMVDLDHFKHVNDTYGHLAGDEVLRQVAARFKRLVRKSDLLARYGGEEFALLLPDTGSEDATAVAEGLREDLESQTVAQREGQPLQVRASFGVAVSHEAWEKLEELLARADLALYSAKQQGRNRVKTH